MGGDPGAMPPGGPGADAFSAGQERAQMWQQSNYLVDPQGPPGAVESGFISGSNTNNPPSMRSGHEETDADGNFIGGEGSLTGSSLYNMDSMHASGETDFLFSFPNFSPTLEPTAYPSSLSFSPPLYITT